MVVLFLTFWGTFILSSIVATSIYIPTNSVGRYCEPFSPYPGKHLLFVVFLTIVILTGVRWCLTVVLIHISLMIHDVEHLFMYQLAICTSSLEQCRFRFSVYFLTELFIFDNTELYGFLIFLDINSLSDTWYANISSYSKCCLFTVDNLCWAETF